MHLRLNLAHGAPTLDPKLLAEVGHLILDARQAQIDRVLEFGEFLRAVIEFLHRIAGQTHQLGPQRLEIALEPIELIGQCAHRIFSLAAPTRHSRNPFDGCRSRAAARYRSGVGFRATGFKLRNP
jgi:hypothetical protein